MVTTLEHGITLVDDALIAQEVEMTAKVDITKISGMVSGKAQFVQAWTHSDETSGSVKGHGDITITPGVGASGVDGITGGVTLIEMVKYKQGITAASDWEYSWLHLPHAA